MLKTYEIMIENGQVIWLEEQPKNTSARAIVTIIEEMPVKEDTSRLSQNSSQILAQLDGQTIQELIEKKIAKDEGMQKILIEKASQILTSLDGQIAKERLEEEIAKDEGMKEILVEKASQILARLGGSQPSLQQIPRRRFEEMTNDPS